MFTGVATVDTSLEAPWKIKSRITFNGPAIPPLGIYPKEFKQIIKEIFLHLVYMVVFFTIKKKRE